MSPVPPAERIVLMTRWDGQAVEIIDRGEHRSLYFGDRSLQSRLSLLRPHELVLSYTAYMVLPLLFTPEPRHILVIGIGAGALIHFFHHHFPHCHIEAVDCSAQVIECARSLFHLPVGKGVAVTCADGCSYLAKHQGQGFDMILVDAFDATGMAPTIYSAEFFRLCARTLAPRGSVSCNLWTDDRRRLRQLKTALADCFPGRLFLPVPDRGNLIAVAMPFATPWPDICLKDQEAARLSRRYGLDFRQLIRVTRQNNLSLPKRLVNWFR